jgi:hypothetical protein
MALISTSGGPEAMAGGKGHAPVLLKRRGNKATNGNIIISLFL